MKESDLPLIFKAEDEGDFRKKVEEALEAANRGEQLSAEEVEAHFAVRRAETRRKLEAKDPE